VHHGRQLLGDGGVDGLDARVDRAGDVLVPGDRAFQGLLGQRANQFLGPRLLGLLGGLNGLVQQGALLHNDFGLGLGFQFFSGAQG
jgi:hypothetical protein